ncbi:MAG TPA: phosphomannomutase/phosphoglucomutase [Cryobacterium sp.]|nr:phosphomannomutase/phosphoglucomutase [Cryobacterium sp.]
MSAQTDAAARLDAVVGPDEVRGTAAAPLTGQLVVALAAAFVDEVGAQGREVLVGHDRGEAGELVAAFARGAEARGATVVDLGVCSTDEIRFGSGTLNAPAARITASSLTLLRAGAQEIGQDHGLGGIRDRAVGYLPDGPAPVATPGGHRGLDLLPVYAAGLRALVGLTGIRPLTVVVDAGRGAAAVTVPVVLGDPAAGGADGQPGATTRESPLTIVPLFFDQDPELPPHPIDPADPATLTDLRHAVIQHEADLGLGFDADAGCCVVVDETGSVVPTSAIGALIARRVIAQAGAENPDRDLVVLHDLNVSRFVAETIEAAGAAAVPTPVGGSLMRAELRATGAVFGCGHSGDYYFPPFWCADSGLLAALHVLAEVGFQPRPLSALATDAMPYAHSGEISLAVDDLPGVYARIVDTFTGSADFEEIDGLTVTGLTSVDEPFWWFNLRPSRTEPERVPEQQRMVRLTVEAGTPEVMGRIRDDVLALIPEE